MDVRCCWYQPPMWRDRLGEGSSCQDKDACVINTELNLEDPVVAERIRKEKEPPKCKRDFPNDVSDLRCDGMKQRKGPSSSEECEDACCRDMSCNVWQWCEAGHECSPEASCFLGSSGKNCTCGVRDNFHVIEYHHSKYIITRIFLQKNNNRYVGNDSAAFFR